MLLLLQKPYIGRYYSQDYVRRKILRQTDVEIKEQDELMAKEIEDGIVPDPMAPVDPETGAPFGCYGWRSKCSNDGTRFGRETLVKKTYQKVVKFNLHYL